MLGEAAAEKKRRKVPESSAEGPGERLGRDGSVCERFFSLPIPGEAPARSLALRLYLFIWGFFAPRVPPPPPFNFLKDRLHRPHGEFEVFFPLGEGGNEEKPQRAAVL